VEYVFKSSMRLAGLDLGRDGRGQSPGRGRVRHLHRDDNLIRDARDNRVHECVFTIIQTADTANVVLADPVYGLYRVANATATVLITGGGLPTSIRATITDATESFVIQSEGLAGIAMSAAPSYLILAKIDRATLSNYE